MKEYSTYKLSKEDLEKIKAWDKCKDKYHGAIGGHLTYCFTPTSLGLIFSVECGRCKEKLDLTDYSEW